MDFTPISVVAEKRKIMSAISTFCTSEDVKNSIVKRGSVYSLKGEATQKRSREKPKNKKEIQSVRVPFLARYLSCKKKPTDRTSACAT